MPVMQLAALYEMRMVITVGVGCSPQCNMPSSELLIFNPIVLTEVIFLLWTLSNFWKQDWLPKFKSKKVKCTLVQALRLRTGRTANWGSRGIALPFLDNGTGRG